MTDELTLQPCNIRELWDVIKPGLEAIKAKWPELSTWRVEDVYAAVIAEQAVLYANEDGFAVCYIDTDKYTGETDLCIWIAYSYDDKRGGILKKHLPSFIEVARHFGCRGVTTASNHPALANMPELSPVHTLYRVLVNGR